MHLLYLPFGCFQPAFSINIRWWGVQSTPTLPATWPPTKGAHSLSLYPFRVRVLSTYFSHYLILYQYFFESSLHGLHSCAFIDIVCITCPYFLYIMYYYLYIMCSKRWVVFNCGSKVHKFCYVGTTRQSG